MNIFTFFRKGKNHSIDDSKSNENVILIPNNYETGFPIDAVYQYMSRDYEQIGYSDAIKNQEPSYKETKKSNILNGLKRHCDQVRLKYSDELRKLEVHINECEEQGLRVTKERLSAKKETYVEHINTIEKIKKSVEENNLEMLSMIESYERGFIRGVAEIAETFINK
jgi:hypothetical protein